MSQLAELRRLRRELVAQMTSPDFVKAIDILAGGKCLPATINSREACGLRPPAQNLACQGPGGG